VALVCESDADAGYVAVMISLEDASPTDDAVMTAWWLVMLTLLTPSP